MKIEFHRHNLGEDELKSLKPVLDSVFLTTGPITEKFEREFGEYFNPTNPPEIVAISSCTMALSLSLQTLGIKKSDEVITTPLSFMATANAIIYAGAKPVFVDVERDTGNINAGLIEKKITKRTKAILPVHLYGQMCDMKAVRKIADRHGLFVIEDSAHCIEGSRKEIRPGQLSNAACFSFHALKTMTCGEGGVILTYDKELAEKLRIMRAHGITRSAIARNRSYSHQDMEGLGLKCNLPDTLSALLIPQIPKLDGRRYRREEIARMYYEGLKGCVEFPKIKLDAVSARNIFSIWVWPDKRNSVIEKLRSSGVGCTVQYYPIIPMLTYYKNRSGYKSEMFPNAEEIATKTIALPFYPSLTEEEIKYVIDTIKEVVKNV